MNGARELRVFVIAGEESGDQLGAGLMEALQARLGGRVSFVGVGGERMQARGLASLFPMDEVGYHGILPVIANLHRIIARMRSTARDVVAAKPDVFVAIDCPGFNLGVARRVRKAAPEIAIVDYVSPTVWVWRPDRARWMARFVDRLMAILPFEPAVHVRLGGPPCVYVGHPLIERLAELRPQPGERPALAAGRPTMLVLPGSRHGEVKRLLQPFGETVARVAKTVGDVEFVLPAVASRLAEIRAGVAGWAVKPTIVEGEAAKFAAFRRAHVALAASGTVTLELALSGVPMAVAYRVDPLVKPFKYALSRIHSFVLPNLVTGANDIPEFLDRESSPANLAAALVPLFSDTPERRRQEASFARLDALMTLPQGTPSSAAADVVLATIRERAGRAQRRLETGT